MNKQRTFAVGDIHGSDKALAQVLERSGFDNEVDKIIFLGDYVDGWSESIEVIKRIIEIKNKVCILGNHDYWFYEFLKFGMIRSVWNNQGGAATIKSYHKNYNKELDELLLSFIHDCKFFYEEDKKLFVHGGFNWKMPVEDHNMTDLTWDRHLWETVKMWDKQNTNLMIKQYDEVFIGHTSTCYDKGVFVETEPQHASNVWNLDQGCGHEGVLTMMDINTKEFWQSDYSKDLYKNEKGRR